MLKPRYSYNDVRQAAYNNQDYFYGTDKQEIDENMTYFVTYIGAGLTLKDKDDNIIVEATQDLVIDDSPFRLEGGVKYTGTGTIQFFRMPKPLEYM